MCRSEGRVGKTSLDEHSCLLGIEEQQATNFDILINTEITFRSESRFNSAPARTYPTFQVTTSLDEHSLLLGIEERRQATDFDILVNTETTFRSESRFNSAPARTYPAFSGSFNGVDISLVRCGYQLE